MKYSSILIVLICILTVSGCDSKEKYAGKYGSIKTGTHEFADAELELKADGHGSWTTDADNVSFRWDIRGKEILLHTKTGGVVAGTVADNIIRIRLPGVGEFSFEKIVQQTF